MVGTFIFIVGEMAGCGVLALPKALVNTGRSNSNYVDNNEIVIN